MKITKVKVNSEFGLLKQVLVCWGEYVPKYEDYKTHDPEFLKFHPYSWDKNLLLKQQDTFFKVLEKKGVLLVFPPTNSSQPWQMYTRDTAFVIGSSMFYAQSRKFGDRSGEIDLLKTMIDETSLSMTSLEGDIEGGDVLVTDSQSCYVGLSSRTNQHAISHLNSFVDTRPLNLGNQVMHLDTRLTILSPTVAIICPDAFTSQDLSQITSKYTCIKVTLEEAKHLATNVFIVNPEMVIVPKQFPKLAEQISNNGFEVISIDYSEPIKLGGSFRCTTMPLVRED